MILNLDEKKGDVLLLNAILQRRQLDAFSNYTETKNATMKATYTVEIERLKSLLDQLKPVQ